MQCASTIRTLILCLAMPGIVPQGGIRTLKPKSRVIYLASLHYIAITEILCGGSRGVTDVFDSGGSTKSLRCLFPRFFGAWFFAALARRSDQEWVPDASVAEADDHGRDASERAKESTT